MATGKPYEATGVQHNKRSLADGTVTTHDYAVREARDSSGRFLEVVESDLPATSTRAATHVVVESLFDPAARTLLQWTSTSKIGTLLHLPPVPVVNVKGTAPKTGDGSVALGHRMIHGYLCTGHKTQTVTAAGAVGNAEPITATREWWVADELHIVMLNITDDARNGETTKELTAINPTEPDPARFHLPSGYTIREVAAPGSSTAGALKPVPPLDLAKAPALSREDAIAKLTSPTQSERLEGAAVLVKGAQSSPDAAVKRDVAYRIARLGIGLAEAHALADEAVKSAESDCASPSAPLARTMDFSRVVVLARYWDTLGYVYYREGDSVTAKSYIESAWKLDPVAYYGSHLSSIYSEAGNNEEAARILKAASQAPGSDELKGDLQERAQALGGNARGGEDSPEPGEALGNQSRFEGTAVFEETYSASSKSPAVNFVSGSEGLRALTPALAKEQANSFVLPDNGPERVVRRVQVVCGAGAEEGCRVRAYSATQARTLAQIH